MSLRKRIINIILVILMIMCIGFSIGYSNKAKGSTHVANIYLDGTEITAEYAEEMQKTQEGDSKSISFTPWAQLDNQSVSFEDLNRTALVDVLEICGNSNLVVNGPILFKDNKDGCLIDSKTSYALFGSYDVVGQVIRYGDRKLTVVGIHSGMENTIVTQVAKDSKVKMDSIAVEATDNITRDVKNFKNRFGISNYSVDSNFYFNIAYSIFLIVPFLMIIFIMVKLVKRIWSVKRKPILFLIYILIGITIAALFIKLLGMEMNIPYDLIPNKWSDFDYWGNLFKGYQDSFKSILYMKKYNIDIPYIESAIKSVFFSISSLVIFISFRKRISIEGSKDGFNLVMFMITVTFITKLIINAKFNLEIDGLLIWWMYPFYYVCTYICTDKFNSLIEEA